MVAAKTNVEKCLRKKTELNAKISLLPRPLPKKTRSLSESEPIKPRGQQHRRREDRSKRDAYRGNSRHNELKLLKLLSSNDLSGKTIPRTAPHRVVTSQVGRPRPRPEKWAEAQSRIRAAMQKSTIPLHPLSHLLPRSSPFTSANPSPVRSGRARFR